MDTFGAMSESPAATAISGSPVLTTFITAIKEAELISVFHDEGPFTIIAPTNDAFNALPEEELTVVLADEETLNAVLKLHVIEGERLSAEDLIAKRTVKAMNGADLTITAAPDGTLTSIMQPRQHAKTLKQQTPQSTLLERCCSQAERTGDMFDWPNQLPGYFTWGSPYRCPNQAGPCCLCS